MPPEPVLKDVAVRVSPAEGIRDVRVIRSLFSDPMIVIKGIDLDDDIRLAGFVDKWLRVLFFGLSTFAESRDGWLNGAASAVCGAAGKMEGPAGRIGDIVGLASLAAFLRS